MRGLDNLGNTCYFNSALQCLLQVPQLSNYMILRKYVGECEFTSNYQELVKKVWLKNENVSESPEKLLKVFKKKCKQFDNFLQQDSQETFLCLLDILDKSLRPFSKVRYPFDDDDGHSFIKELFYGKTVRETICKSEKTKTFEPSTIQILFVHDNTTLDKLITSNQSWATLTDFVDTKGVTHNVAATRNLYWYNPPILVFSMKMYSKKFEVDVPENLDLTEYTHPDSPYKSNTKYTLFATCKHRGSIHGGHYMAFTKHKGQWYKKDDEQCDKIDNFPFSDTHYLVLYKLANS